MANFTVQFQEHNKSFDVQLAVDDNQFEVDFGQIIVLSDVVDALTVTENGTYTAPEGVDGYSPVTVNVPIPDGYIVPSGELEVTENGEHNVTEYASVDVDVPIPDGYIQPTGEMEVTENGTHDVTEYASVNVNVAAEVDTSIEDGLITNTLTEYSNSRVTALGAAALYSRTQIVSISFPNVKTTGDSSLRNMTALTSAYVPNITTCGSNCFYGATKLTQAEMPLVTSLGANAFYNCSALVTADHPLATTVGATCFRGCSKLTTVNLPKVAKLNNSTFYSCKALTTLDFPSVTYIGTQAFYACNALNTLILRSTTMATLANTNAFTGAYHFLGTVNATYNPDGLKDGYIYVPSALIDTYKAATNWSTFADQFRAIEDYPDICG